MWIKVKNIKGLKAGDIVRYTSNDQLKCNLGWIGGDLTPGADNYRAIDNISKYGIITIDDNWLCQGWRFDNWDHWEKWVPNNKDEKQKNQIVATIYGQQIDSYSWQWSIEFPVRTGHVFLSDKFYNQKSDAIRAAKRICEQVNIPYKVSKD